MPLFRFSWMIGRRNADQVVARMMTSQPARLFVLTFYGVSIGRVFIGVVRNEPCGAADK